MKLAALLVCAGCLWAGAARSQSRVTATVRPEPAGAAIPADFIGLSFGMKTLLPDKAGARFFSPTNAPLVTLFQNLGIRHLRVGGTTVESPVDLPMPGERDVDELFSFARAAGVHKVIYSLRLLETNSTERCDLADAAIAKYIWGKYRDQLDCFSIGNEPDRRKIYAQDPAITNFSSYLGKWRRFAAAVTNAVPSATFGGPDGGSGEIQWTTNFARAQKSSGLLKVVTEHFYVGGAGRDVNAPDGLEAILSPGWLEANQRLYDRMAAPVLAEGLPYRFTEASDHYSGGVPGASDTFAGALWALDFLHWWAAHGTRGVNFHNTQWVVNDVITRDPVEGLRANPKGYGLRAFDLGSRGQIEGLELSNPDKLNLTAYAVRCPTAHFVTLINKEHGPGGRAAQVTVVVPGAGQAASAMFLATTNGNAAAQTGVTLGGASIRASAPWAGKWEPLPPGRLRQCVLKVPPTSAVILQIAPKQPK